MRRSTIIILTLLIMAQTACALPVEFEEFLESASDAVMQMLSELSKRMIYMGMIWSKLTSIKYEVYNNLAFFLLETNPPLKSAEILTITNYFIRILHPAYVIAIVVTGVYLMFFSTSPTGRTNAKYMLMKLIIAMILTSVSIQIIEVFLNTSKELTKSVISLGPKDVGYNVRKAVDYLNSRTMDFMWSNVVVGLPFMLVALTLTVGVFMVIITRYFILFFLVIFFPVSIFLSLFKPTQNIGRVLTKNLIYWLFLPVGYAIILLTVGIGSQSLISMMIQLTPVINLTGGIIILISPFMIFKMMDWVTMFIATSTQYVSPTGSTVSQAALDGLDSPESQISGRTKRRKKKKSRLEAAAVGISGYTGARSNQGDDEGDMDGDDSEAAIGFRGYHRKRKKPGTEKKEKQRGYAPTIRKPWAHSSTSLRTSDLMGVSGVYEEEIVRDGKRYTIRKGADGEILEELVDVDQSKEGWESIDKGAHAVFQKAGSKEPISKERGIILKLGDKSFNQVNLELAPGESKTIDVLLLNDTERTFEKIGMYDEDLSDACFDILYKPPKLSLKAGEAKKIKIKIEASEKMPDSKYEGSIIFKTETSLRVSLTVTIKAVFEKKEKFMEDEEIEGFGDGTEKKKKKTIKVKKINSFGEEIEVEVEVDDDSEDSGDAKKKGEEKPRDRPLSIKTVKGSIQPEEDYKRVDYSDQLVLMKPMMSNLRYRTQDGHSREIKRKRESDIREESKKTLQGADSKSSAGDNKPTKDKPAGETNYSEFFGLASLLYDKEYTPTETKPEQKKTTTVKEEVPREPPKKPETKQDKPQTIEEPPKKEPEIKTTPEVEEPEPGRETQPEEIIPEEDAEPPVEPETPPRKPEPIRRTPRKTEYAKTEEKKTELLLMPCIIMPAQRPRKPILLNPVEKTEYD